MSIKRKALISLFIGAFGIGLAPIFPKLAVESEQYLPGGGIGIIATAFWRTALASPLFWWLHLRSGSRNRTAIVTSKKLLLLPGIVFAAALAVWHKSFEYTTLANATLLVNLASIFVAVISYLWLKERLGWTFALGAIVALIGTGVLLGVDFKLGRDPLFGDALGLLTACFYTCYLLLLKMLRKTMSVSHIMAYASTISAIGLLIIASVSGAQIVPSTVEAWLSVMALAFIVHAGGQGLIVYAMAHLPASFAGLGLLIQPLVTAVVSWILFAQVLSGSQISGGALILTGILIAPRGAQHHSTEITRRW